MKTTDVFFACEPWYVVYCKPRKEAYTANILSNQLGLTIYLPEIETYLQREIRRIPFFSGYFFVQANLQKVDLSRINSSPGVLKLLDFGDGPLIVPHVLVEMLREEISKRSICNHSSYNKLAPGDSVRITDGPFEGLPAVFLESLNSGERARTLLHFLGRLSRVQVDMNSLEKLNTQPLESISNAPPRRERRTRGKGRRINRTHYIADRVESHSC